MQVSSRLMPPPLRHLIAGGAGAAAILCRSSITRSNRQQQQQQQQHRPRGNSSAAAVVTDQLPSQQQGSPQKTAVALLALLSTASVSMLLATLRRWSIAVVSEVGEFRSRADADAASGSIDVGAVSEFCGAWSKVAARCEHPDAFCDLFGVPRWLRQATRLMSGLELSLEQDALVVRQLCRLKWLNTREIYELSGAASVHAKRRDMRSGEQVGQLLSAESGDGSSTMQLRVELRGGLRGHAVDTLQLLSAPGGGVELVVLHEACIEGRGSAAFKEVFRRRS